MSQHPNTYPRVALTWACMQARALGYTWTIEGETFVVDTGENIFECINAADFVAFISEQRKP